jgi:hypothetical protein
MISLVVSDLHLGGREGSEVVRAGSAALDALLAALDGVDRLVLLGDALELRHGPAREALASARPVLTEIGRHVDEVVMVPGNHDHALIGAWLEREGRDVPPALALEHRILPAQASWIAVSVAEWLGEGLTVAYPGIWLRDDVYAHHGHYLDLHTTVPTFERLAAGLSARISGPIPPRATAADYEARLAPIYGWMDATATWAAPGGDPAGRGAAAARAYHAMTGGDGGRVHRIRSRALGLGFPVAVGVVNRLGLGPVRADLSGTALREGMLGAMNEVVTRLDVGARHVLFGHSHRAGPLPGDDRAQWGRLMNTGSWVAGHGPSEAGRANPYAPGHAIRVDDAGGDPQLVRLLEG